MLVDIKNFNKICHSIVVHRYKLWEAYYVEVPNRLYPLFATFEDFILLVYTVIDDLYQQFAPACVS